MNAIRARNEIPTKMTSQMDFAGSFKFATIKFNFPRFKIFMRILAREWSTFCIFPICRCTLISLVIYFWCFCVFNSNINVLCFAAESNALKRKFNPDYLHYYLSVAPFVLAFQLDILRYNALRLVEMLSIDLIKLSIILLFNVWYHVEVDA